MHHCAPRILLSQSTSFTNLLQVAAARAWVRTATSSACNRSIVTEKIDNTLTTDFLTSVLCHHNKYTIAHIYNSTTASEFHLSSQDTPTVTETPISARQESYESPSQYHNAVTYQPSQLSSFNSARTLRLRRSVTYFQVESVTDSDFQYVDPGRSYTYGLGHLSQTIDGARSWDGNDTSLIGVHVGEQLLQARPIPFIPLAKTSISLYRNILYILSYRPTLPSVPALLDYHDLHPNLRSTRSYNLLIWFALRHNCFGTAQWLLTAMRADGLTANVETLKLKVRWLVHTGSWDRAWNEMVGSNTAPDTLSSNSPGGSAIPLPVWLEFFRTLRRGAFDGRMKKRHDGSHAPILHFDSEGVHSARYRALMANAPSVFHNLTRISPRTVYFVVLTMLKTGDTAAAVTLTKSYFQSLPPRISVTWIRTCLDIIHLHVVMGSSHRGLKRFYEARRTMNTFIALHPAFRPTSMTLFALLAPLRQAKRCGTVAWRLLRHFKCQWGTRTEDRRVRRRIAALAVKEGRMDIVSAILHTEQIWRKMYQNWKTKEMVLGRTTPAARQHLRPPSKELFKYNGREERHWHILKRRIKRVVRDRRDVKGRD